MSRPLMKASNDGDTGTAMDIKKHHESQMLQRFFGQFGVEVSDEFIERFEAFRASVRASEDQWIIDNCHQVFDKDGRQVVIVQLNKVIERMKENRLQEVKSFRQPFEEQL